MKEQIKIKENDLSNRIQTLCRHSDGLYHMFIAEIYTSFTNLVDSYDSHIAKLERKIEELQKEVTFKNVE